VKLKRRWGKTTNFPHSRSFPTDRGPAFDNRLRDLVDDIGSNRMAYAYILRSPYAHAKIKYVDTSKARSIPGVIEVLTGEAATKNTNPLPQAIQELPLKDYCLAFEEVVYIGQPVAAVVARDRYTA
jgi:CO/xanthine dehydrogenase Mo-binding subunit